MHPTWVGLCSTDLQMDTVSAQGFVEHGQYSFFPWHCDVRDIARAHVLAAEVQFPQSCHVRIVSNSDCGSSCVPTVPSVELVLLTFSSAPYFLVAYLPLLLRPQQIICRDACSLPLDAHSLTPYLVSTSGHVVHVWSHPWDVKRK